MSSAANRLRKARTLIERGWTQGYAARTKSGNPIGYYCAKAACWCMVGAMWRCGANPADFKPLEQAIDGNYIGPWNDAPERTQAEVLAAFDRAIELAEVSQ